MPCSRWSPAGCRIWGRLRLRNLENCSDFCHLRLKKPCFAWKPAAPCCGDSSRTMHRGPVHPASAWPRNRTRVVRTALAGAHSPADGRHAAQADRAGHRGAVHALAVALAACGARKRRSRENAPRSMYCASCRDLKFRPMPGSGRFWPAHLQLRSQVARPALSDRRRGLGTVCLRILQRSTTPRPESGA